MESESMTGKGKSGAKLEWGKWEAMGNTHCKAPELEGQLVYLITPAGCSRSRLKMAQAFPWVPSTADQDGSVPAPSDPLEKYNIPEGRVSDGEGWAKPILRKNSVHFPPLIDSFKPTLHSLRQLGCREHHLMHLIDSITHTYTCVDTSATVHLSVL